MSQSIVFERDVAEIVDHLHAAGETVEARTAYSGRGMHGATCLGFVVEQPHRFMFRLGKLLGADVLDADIVEALEDLDVSTDSMGLQTIVYFPAVGVVADGQQ